MTERRVEPGKHKRRRSGTAEWHMSRSAVSLSVPEVLKWSDKQCLDFLVEARFGSWETVSCPHCGSISKHYWRPLQRRWQCQGCLSTFSITSKTPLADRKLPLQSLIASYLMFMNSAAGQPALELKRHMDKTYNTVFVLQQKMREGFVRGHNVGLVSGDLEMDGAHQAGRRSAEKRGKPQASRPVDANTDVNELNAAMLTQTAKQAARKAAAQGGKRDPDFGKRLPKDRRILMVVSRRSGVKGKGSNATRVAIGQIESEEVARAVTASYVAVPESFLNTDTSVAYSKLGKEFRVHRTVEHSKEVVGPNGENNNLAEELNFRMDRAEQGIYLNIEPKYLLDYAAEVAFRSDTRRLPNGDQLKLALCVTLNVGPSLFWRGYTRGKHRTVELVEPKPLPALASGPKKGRSPNSQENGRAPR